MILETCSETKLKPIVKEKTNGLNKQKNYSNTKGGTPFSVLRALVYDVQTVSSP